MLRRKRSKPRRVSVDRDPGYLAFLRERKCVACMAKGKRGPGTYYEIHSCDPAHGPVNGMGSKGPDSGAIPLCRAHHEEQHRINWPAFEAKYSIDREKEAMAHHAVYVMLADPQ
jgi:hypothetical protein